MTVDLNGARCDVGEAATLLTLIEMHTGTTRGSAVVVDGTVVPRSDWPSYQVRDGQHIELIKAVQGG